MSKEVPNWVTDMQIEIQKQQDEYMKTRSEYVKLPLGETVVIIENRPPIKGFNKWGNEQYTYTVNVNGEEKKLSANVILHIGIIQALSESINPMTIIRTGKGKETRYSIKELEST